MITIRQMTLADLPAIDEMQRVAFIPELWEDMSLFQGILEKYDRSSFAAHKNGVLLGYLLTHPSRITRDDFENGCEELSGDEDSLYIHDLCIHPNGRGAGIAKLLLQNLEEFAKENGFSRFAGIAVQNTDDFWLKQGLVPLKAYTYRGEPGMLMVRELAS
jgi:ribosomal protein S18 acetylase RimI-like enzyme